MANYRAIAAQDARRAGIPVDVFLRQIQQESGFNPNARSGAGAVGIAQFIPSTAREYGVNPLDPISSLAGAAAYDARLLHQYGSIARALSAYNSGKPDAYLDPNFAGGQTYNYVRSILGNRSAASGGAPPPPTVSSAAPRPPAAAPSAPPVTSGIPLPVAQTLNANNRLIGLPDFNYPGVNAPSTPLAASMAQPLRVQVDHNKPVSPNAAGVVALAEKYRGTPYKWGGTTPAGFDCSGFVQYLYAQKGISIPRTTYEQFKTGTPVSRSALKPGDVVFFEPTAQGPGHEGLFIGHGQFIQAPHTGDVVKISRLADYRNVYVGARRMG